MTPAQNQTISFITPGVLNLEAALTMGLSAKEKEDSIGRFGTGINYGVAVLLRNGCAIKIETGGKVYFFGTRKITERGKEFDLVILQEEGQEPRPIGFTTQLGRDWEPEMAYREFASNTMDEEGQILLGEYKLPAPYSPQTIITISGEAIIKAHAKHDKIFLNQKIHPLLWKSKTLEIRNGTNYSFYYRGVCVGSIGKTKYTYNMLENITLTEDRIMRSEWDSSWELAKAICFMQEEDAIKAVLCAGDGFKENELEYRHSVDFFLNCAQKVKHDSKCNPSAIELLKKIRPNTTESFELTKVQMAQLTKALSFLARLGFEVKYPIRCAKLPDKYMGQAENGTIFLSETPFRQGTKQLTKTIFEEYCHLRFGVHDCNYDIQHLYLDTIMTLGENILGEPL